MAIPVPDPSSSARLAQRLDSLRQQRFVGREHDLAMFGAALEAADPPFALLYVYGAGGVGKTTLVDTFSRLSLMHNRTVVRVDGRAVEPSPAGFIRALSLPPGVLDGTETLDGPLVLFVDTYEQISTLDAWLRETFIPGLPDDTMVVIAGRNPPSAAWQIDPGWGALFRVLPLPNLGAEEARRYLALRNVPESARDVIVASTHGHPLALSLVADVVAQGDIGSAMSWVDAPDVVRVLLERFVEGVPSALHRQALQVCAHVRVTTEALLAEALGVPDPQPLFAWMRDLSFIEQGAHGLFPHDLARDVLDADLRWRNAEAYRDLHRRVRGPIVRRLQDAPARDKQQASFDLLYLHRNNPIMKPFHQWETFGSAYAEPASPADTDTILELVSHHEGPASVRIAHEWVVRQPHAFTVFRSSEGAIIGFATILHLEDSSAGDHPFDPAVEAAHRFALRHGPLRTDETMLYHRFAIGRDTYQSASVALDMVVMTTIVAWLSTPRLAWTFQAFADPEAWHPTMSYINVQRVSEADFTVGGHRYGVFAHDWRAQSPVAWLDFMADREIDTRLTPHDVQAAQPLPVIVLSEEQFRDAVRQALRDFHRPVVLATNPLMRSRLVTDRSDTIDEVAPLQVILAEALATLKDHPRDERLYRAIHRTFVAPAPTQELAAEALGLPFSTYRYHLTSGIQRITDVLWQRELYGSSTS